MYKIQKLNKISPVINNVFDLKYSLGEEFDNPDGILVRSANMAEYEVKENLLGVTHEVLEEKTAVCEDVAIAMVKGACKVLNTDYAVAATGIAGPGGGTKEIPVGTIWLAVGTPENIITFKIDEDHGRDINLTIATNKAMTMLRDFLKAEESSKEE